MKKYVGLTREEVRKSREENGTNELEKKKKESVFQKVLHIFTAPMFLLLLSPLVFILSWVRLVMGSSCFVLSCLLVG